jgi:transcriptional regulator GlxA family with amidase domain
MLNVGIFIFNDIELLDFAGPFEVFSVSSSLNQNELFEVFTVTEDGKAIKSVNGLKVLPDYSFSDHPQIDLLIIPGGIGSKTEMQKETVLQWITDNYKSSKLTMSVCSGARLLGKLGLLDGVECITHHEVIPELIEIAPKAIIKAGNRFLGKDKLYTSAGVSAGIDLSLHIVKMLYGSSIEAETRVYMEYEDWGNL